MWKFKHTAKVLLIFIGCLFSWTQAFAIRSVFGFAVFNDAKNKPYLETHLRVSTLNLKANMDESKKKIKASVLVEIKLFKGDSLFLNDKYRLQTPWVDSIHKMPIELIYLERYQITTGRYRIQTLITDEFDTSSHASSSNYFELNFPTAEIGMSDIIFGEISSSAPEKFKRLNTYFLPRPNDVFLRVKDTVTAYLEIYHTDLLKDSVFYLKTQLIEKGTDEVLYEYGSLKAQKPKESIGYMFSLPLDNLKQGEYTLVVSVMNSKGEDIEAVSANILRMLPPKKEVAQEKPIEIIPIWVRDIPLSKLIDYSKAMYILYNPSEAINAKNILETGKPVDSAMLQKFFTYFWYSRSSTPQILFEEFESQVFMANQLYGCKQIKGYNTDRGRAFILFGKADQVFSHPNEQDAVPYEVWQYYSLKPKFGYGSRQSSVRFVFANPTRSSCGYQQVYSTARGEISNPDWTLDVFKNGTAPPNVLDQ